MGICNLNSLHHPRDPHRQYISCVDWKPLEPGAEEVPVGTCENIGYHPGGIEEDPGGGVRAGPHPKQRGCVNWKPVEPPTVVGTCAAPVGPHYQVTACINWRPLQAGFCDLNAKMKVTPHYKQPDCIGWQPLESEVETVGTCDMKSDYHYQDQHDRPAPPPSQWKPRLPAKMAGNTLLDGGGLEVAYFYHPEWADYLVTAVNEQEGLVEALALLIASIEDDQKHASIATIDCLYNAAEQARTVLKKAREGR